MENNVINRIKNELDIVDIVSEHVDLSKKGRNYWGICPFHEDSNPSMSVSPEKQLFKCFVCQAGGDLIKFTSDINNISFSQSLRDLGKRLGIEVETRERKGPTYTEEQQKMIYIHKDAMDFFQYSLSTPQGAKALEYIRSRNLNQLLVEQFLIGYAPESGLKDFLISKGHDEANIINASLINSVGGDFFRDRLVFGIKNHNGDIVSFSARDLSGKSNAKYINSAESALFSKNSILYNFADANEVIKKEKEVFINEGFMDVIAMYRAGIRNSVAIMGTALTDNHAKLLKRFKVVLMLDGDKAGISATIKSIKTLLSHGIKVEVVKNNTQLDPDEILSKDGAEALIEFSKNQTNALEFIFELHTQKFVDINPNTIKEFVASFSKYLETQDKLTREFYISKMASYLKVSVDTITSIVTPVKQVVQEQYVPTPPKGPEVVRVTKNDTYKLIKSMILNNKLNNKLIDIFIENTPYLIEPVIKAIGSYLVDAKKGIFDKKPTKEMKHKVEEIKDYDSFVNTEEEFKELIKRVEKESYEWEIEANDVKLERTDSDDEKIKLLEKNIVLKRELKNRMGS